MSRRACEGRVSVLTPAGRGAIAVVAAEGLAAAAAADLHFEAANRRPFHQQQIGRIVFGHWRAAGDHREEVIACRQSAGQFELHCHGGVAAAARIVAALVEAGCRATTWQEWRRDGGECPIAAQADVALAAATTRRTAAILLDQRHGALAAALRAAASEMLRGDRAAARARLAELLRWSSLGRRLAEPWRVAIAGRPNVGKSSLLNAMVGYQRAIVFDQPGTTRDVLTADTAIDGWPVRLSDSAGIRESTDPLEAEGVSRAKAQLTQVDLVLWVLDATDIDMARPTAASAALMRDAGGQANDLPKARALVTALNKVDRVALRPDLPLLGVSALTGEGLDQLLAAIAQKLVPELPPAGAAIPFTSGQVASIERAVARLDEGDLTAAAAELAGIGERGA